MSENPLYLLVLLLSVAKRHHIGGHALAAIGVVAALHFSGAKRASVVVNGDIGPVRPGINTNLFRLHGLACGQAAGGHLRLFQNAVPEFLHMAKADANAGVICLRGDRR